MHITGIDVMPRVVEIARAQIAASPAASRIDIRHQDVAELTDTECYDPAWIPAPFVPEPAISTGVARVAITHFKTAAAPSITVGRR